MAGLEQRGDVDAADEFGAGVADHAANAFHGAVASAPAQVGESATSPAAIAQAGDAAFAAQQLAVTPLAAVDASRVEFDGRVRHANAVRHVMRLTGGLSVEASDSTVWSARGDLFDLAAVVAALDAGRDVRIEGRGELQSDGSIVARRIKAEVDDDEDDDGDDGQDTVDEFESRVRSANSATGTLRLRGGATVKVTDSTIWSARGDLFDLAAVVAALDAGRDVRAEGRGELQSDGSIVARRIKAEVDDDEDDDGDDSDDGDDGGSIDEFESRVGSVNVGSGTLRLRGGLTVKVTDSTIWSARGDLFSVAAVAEAVAAGRDVRVEGRGELQSDGSIVARRIKAEVDDDDDSDDDGDDGDDGGSTGPLTVQVHPDEWRTEWASGSNSGGGGDAIELRFEGRGFDEIRGDTVRLAGPGGELAPLSTRLHDDSFRAEFAKRDAIGLLGAVQDGDRVALTVSGELENGSLFEFELTVKVRDDDD